MVGWQAMVASRYAMVHGKRSGTERADASQAVERRLTNRMDTLLARRRESAEGGAMTLSIDLPRKDGSLPPLNVTFEGDEHDAAILRGEGYTVYTVIERRPIHDTPPTPQ